MDEEHRLSDLGAEIGQAARRQVAGEHGSSDRVEAEQPGEDHLLGAVDVDCLAHGADSRTLGNDRLEAVRLGRLLKHHLAADRETDAADPVVLDVRPSLEERDRRFEVARPLPAEEIRISLALALATPVEEQHAVAVAGEEPGGLLRALAPREGDDGRAVSRRHVPAHES
jgi:hypothetical protein